MSSLFPGAILVPRHDGDKERGIYVRIVGKDTATPGNWVYQYVFPGRQVAQETIYERALHDFGYITNSGKYGVLTEVVNGK